MRSKSAGRQRSGFILRPQAAAAILGDLTHLSWLKRPDEILWSRKSRSGTFDFMVGARRFDPDALLILHEDAGNEFVHAFLVAHELGHVEFDGREDADATASADPMRPAEAAPIGIDRVVDYGRRERREVQMDLFAREFILPRPVAQRLHLVDAMTASQIAERLAAPFDVVALQLLDGLLLPRVELTSAEP